MAAVIGKFNCAVFDSAATDVSEIYAVAAEARAAAMKKGMPAFLRFRYYRYLEHVGVTEDFEVGYRSRAEAEQWLQSGDPVKLQREKLVAAGLSRQVAMIERDIDAQVAKSLAAAKRAPFPPKSDLHKDVFYEKRK
jgi:TPP-dependent pyruvate/acetoin dehydrogenase alpha subunit